MSKKALPLRRMIERLDLVTNSFTKAIPTVKNECR